MLILKCIRWSYLGIGNLSTAKKPTHLKKPLPPLPSSATPSTTATAPGGNRVTTELEKNALTTIGIGAKPMKWKQFFTDYSTMKWQISSFNAIIFIDNEEFTDVCNIASFNVNVNISFMQYSTIEFITCIL